MSTVFDWLDGNISNVMFENFSASVKTKKAQAESNDNNNKNTERTDAMEHSDEINSADDDAISESQNQSVVTGCTRA